ncbi:MAG: hypothetical protein Q9227_008599 [Pyrenula ochraceoflavens]
MPAVRPSAAFEPISPDIDLASIVESTPNFQYVVRIHCDMIDEQGIANFEKLVLLHVILGGKPLVIEGYQERLDRWTFALQWLRDNCSQKVENARDLTKKSNLPLSVGHYLNNMALLTNQWSSKNYKDPNRQRIYLKDIDCPPIWHDKLRDLIPLGLFYLNDTTGDFDGLGAADEPNPRGGTRKGRGIAKAGDLMSSLPPEMRAENMMCYIGHEGTYTPCHREMCASLGQNIMVETSTGLMEDGKPTKPGSSIWFMTESRDRHLVSEYWLGTLGHDIEIEDHFAQINAWKAAPFKTYVVEQRVGDLILIPPLAPHQVWNRGTRTMKAAWNRTTVETLEMALEEAVPKARMVCRDEQYKNKAIVYYTCLKYSQQLKTAEKELRKIGTKSDAKTRQLHKDFRRLHALFTRILISESFLPDGPEKNMELVPFDSNITCSYCRCNIFNRFLTCPSCIVEEDTYDICMECYAMGRSCACISKLRWVEQFEWTDLTQKHDVWRHQIIQHEGEITGKSPRALKTEIARFGKKTLAQICQLELKRRPWRDITKPDNRDRDNAKFRETVVDDQGNVSKRKIRRTEKWEREHKSCHICKWKEPTWKQAQCDDCGNSFCYGTLFRGFDILPQTILESNHWTCPKCRQICPCRDCIKKPGNNPYEPLGTIPGWDTKKIADPRSVQSLVDFGQSNMNWVKKAGDDHPRDTRRLDKKQKAAEAAKSSEPILNDEHYDNEEQNLLRLAEQEGIVHNDLPIDPALGETGGVPPPFGDEAFDMDSEDFNEDPEVPHYNEFRNRGPPPPQFVVPTGGVIRDMDHAYDITEAITYDYPDPEVGMSLPAPPNPPPAPVNDLHPGYEAAYQSPEPSAQREPHNGSPAPIEMINKKRKRPSESQSARKRSRNEAKEGESHTPKPLKPSRKLLGIRKIRSRTDTRNIHGQPTLLLKLSVDKVKLNKINKEVIVRDQALAEAPKIGSDLRALNVTGVTEEESSAAPARKVRIERVDDDEEFAPSRRRDRRKDRTVPRDSPTGIGTSRRQRTKVVEYEDPSDLDDLDEVDGVRPSPRDHTRSKWLERRRQMDPSDIVDDESRPNTAILNGNAQPQAGPVSEDASNGKNMEDIASAALASAARQARNGIDTSHTQQQSANHQSSSRDAERETLDPRVLSLSPTRGKSSTNSKAIMSGALLPTKKTNSSVDSRPVLMPKKVSPKPALSKTNVNISTQVGKRVSEAEENRRAKLAAASWAEGDGDYDSFEEDSSDYNASIKGVPSKPPPSSLRPKSKSRPSMSKEVESLKAVSNGTTSKVRPSSKSAIFLQSDSDDSMDEIPATNRHSKVATPPQLSTPFKTALGKKPGRPRKSIS